MRAGHCLHKRPTSPLNVDGFLFDLSLKPPAVAALDFLAANTATTRLRLAWPTNATLGCAAVLMSPCISTDCQVIMWQRKLVEKWTFVRWIKDTIVPKDRVLRKCHNTVSRTCSANT